MKNIKKLFIAMILLFVTFALAGCKDNNNEGNNNQGGDTQPNNPSGEVVFDFMGQDFVIMVDLPSSVDPRSETYQKLFKEEKKELIDKVEKKYNLHVVYKAFPSEASWGGARERYIIQKSVSGIKDVHVYEIPSYSVGSLALQKAIVPLTSYIEKYANKGYWPESKANGIAMGEQYGYSDFYSLADEGLYYNTKLIKQVFGEENGDLPSRLWLEGKWTWEEFEKMIKTMDEQLPEDCYVMGGAGYNWAYQLLGANGVHVVDTDLKCGLATQAGIDTVAFLNRIYNTYRWDMDVPLSNATSAHMVEGKVAFHNGQSYWIFQDNKWGQRAEEDAIGFVPYPIGPNVKDTTGLSDYYINNVYGTSQYTISSSFAKENVKEGYENSTLYDEIIFKIWSELQYFPPIDSETGFASRTEVFDEYKLKRLEKYYANEASVQAHYSVLHKAYPDYFYSLGDEANGHTGSSYMCQLQGAIKEGTTDGIRSSMLNIAKMIQESFRVKFSLPDDYYEEIIIDDETTE